MQIYGKSRTASRVSSRTVALILVANTLLLDSTLGQTVRNWTGPDGGDWFTATNWSPNGSPASGDFLTLGVGDDAATASTVNISFGGTLHMTNAAAAMGNLFVGATADGTLTMVNNSTLSTAHVQIGSNSNGDGYAAIAGNGANWNVTGGMTVGNAGRGLIDITADAEVTTTSFLILGGNVTGTGVANVSGTGSLLNAQQGISVGLGGVGMLSISNDAQVVSSNISSIANSAGANGIVTIDSRGIWTNSSGVTVGEGGQGRVEIRGGGQASTWDVSIGGLGTGVGHVSVAGVDSVWQSTNFFTVGGDGYGELEIRDGGRVESFIASIGGGASGIGQVIVRNGGIWSAMDLAVGNSGNASLLIEQGGIVESSTSEIGTVAGSVGRVIVDGENSIWDTDGPLVVGNLGTAELSISQGGLVRSEGGSIAESSEMIVNGVGSGFGAGINTTFQINGRLNITNGASASGSHVIAGDPAGILGVISVRDEGSRFQARDLTIDSGSILVDPGARASVSEQTALLNGGALILDGGEFTTEDLDATDGELALFSGTMTIRGGTFHAPAGTLELGSSATSDLVLNFTDGATDNTDVMVIADTGKATVNYSEGSTHTNGSGTTIGKEAGSQGTLNLTGAGTQFKPSDYLYVGESGQGTVNISDGAVADSDFIVVGVNAGSSGVVNVSGSQTTFGSGTDDIIVGDAGRGELHLTDHATGNFNNMQIGADAPGLYSVVTVADKATLHVTGTLGMNRSSVLRIDGGSVNVINAATTLSGNSTIELLDGQLRVEELTATDLGSHLEFRGGKLIVESLLDLANTLSVPTGGSLVLQGNIVGSVASQPGSTITIDSPVATMGDVNNTNSINLQGSLNVGANTLTLNSFFNPARLGEVTNLEGGQIIAPAGISLGDGDVLSGGFGSTSVVTGRVAAGVGSLIAGALTLGDNTKFDGFVSDGILLTFNSTVTLHDANEAVLGSLTQLGHELIPGQAGTLVAANGAVLDFGRNIVGYGTVDTPDDPLKPFINNGHIAGNSLAEPITLEGYVKGVGTMDNVVVTGTSAPGFSPATVNYGSVEYAGTLEIELAGLLAGNFDKIIHSGVAELGGALDVSLINGFMPSAGNTFEIITAASGVNGTFSTEILPSLGGGLDWDVSYGTNNVVLSVVTAGLPGDFDFDGDVDGRDFLIWQRGGSPSPLSSGDLADWQGNYGTSSFTANIAVREPGSASLIALAVAFITKSRRRRKCLKNRA